MSQRRIILCLLLTLLTPITAWSADVYFAADTISPTLLEPPFADGSANQKKDLDVIIQLQQKPDPAQIKQAQLERDMKPETVLLPVMDQLKRADYPALYHLLDKVGHTSHGITDTAKNYWKTNRPYIVDKRVKSLINSHSNFAYPSGHTAGSYTWAHVMNLLIPERGKDFYAKAESIAQNRALVGMHFPHDLSGGRQLALITIGSLLQNKDFIEDLEKARGEVGEKVGKKGFGD